MDYSHIHRPGLDFTRSVIARCLDDSGVAAIELAQQRFGRDVAAITKGDIVGVEAVDVLDAGLLTSARAEFIAAAEAMSIVGSLQGLRIVSANLPYCPTSEAAVGYWVGESKALRVSRAAFQRASLPPLKVAAIVVASREALRSDPRAEELFRRDLLRAVALAKDGAFINGGAGTPGETPAAINNGAVPIASVGTPEDDLAAAVAEFQGDFRTAAWIMAPQTAAAISTRLKLGSELGLRGGVLLGLPVVVSAAVPTTSAGATITLLDAGGVAAVAEDFTVAVSTAGMIEMSDDPTAATDTPAGATQAAVSLFQADAVAIRVVQRANWANGRAGGVVVIDGVAYTGA